MDRVLHETVVWSITSVKGKRVETDSILAAVRQQASATISDFEIEERLLAILKELEGEGRLQLPKSRSCWNQQTGLPRFVTAVRKEMDEARLKRREAIHALQNETIWEPTRMAAFAHTLKSITELERAVKVNRYLLSRTPETVSTPHRERALIIFGDEKALDRYTRKGLFGGRITLSDLDCFYCPEPLPFHTFSMEKQDIAKKPLLVVENANTYWSCCRANQIAQRFAAVVYGQGFKVVTSAAERANDGLLDIEKQLRSAGIAYFGDLDPTGIAIPNRINVCRKKNGLAPLYAERSLYRALLEIDHSTSYEKSQLGNHDPDMARQWLGEELAGIYLARAHKNRWPQEGVSVTEIVTALAS